MDLNTQIVQQQAFPACFRPLRDNFLYSVPASDYNGNVEGGYNNE